MSIAHHVFKMLAMLANGLEDVCHGGSFHVAQHLILKLMECCILIIEAIEDLTSVLQK